MLDRWTRQYTISPSVCKMKGESFIYISYPSVSYFAYVTLCSLNRWKVANVIGKLAMVDRWTRHFRDSVLLEGCQCDWKIANKYISMREASNISEKGVIH